MTDFTPHVDACETEKGYELQLALPGVKAENIEIDFQEGKLTISGERKLERKEDGRRYHMMETQYGAFSRSFYLPDKIDPDKISAHFEDGVLLVNVPKDEHKTMKRQINVTSSAGNGSKGKLKADDQKGEKAESSKSKKAEA
ncbi:Hsp20/alpha crystallin family protein [Pontibacter sp. CAU 1760]